MILLSNITVVWNKKAQLWLLYLVLYAVIINDPSSLSAVF